MQQKILIATAFSAALAVSAAAQTGTGSSATQDTKKNEQITVTGCLQQGSAPGSTASGTSGTSGSSSEFMLTNAIIGTGSSTGSTGTSGSATAGSSAAVSYKLMGRQDDLKPHVNAKVEIRGTLEKPTDMPSSTGTAASGAAAGSAGDMKTLRVTSVRKVADSCTAK